MFKNGTPSRPGGATTRNAPPETAWIRNIRAYLRRRGNSATALSRRAGLKSTYVRDILNGRSRGPRTDKLLQLARAMDTTLDALLGDPAFANARGVPLLWSVATRAGESAPDVQRMAEPVPLVAPPTGIQAASDCFAARVLDRSVDRIYPPGSLVFCRPPPLDGRLPAEHPLIVRFLSVPGRDESLEVLIGHLARTDAGDLLLRTCSTLPELEHFRTIRPAFDSFDQIPFATDRTAPYDFDAARDLGEILGTVIAHREAGR